MTTFSISSGGVATNTDLYDVDLQLDVEDIDLDIGGEVQVVVPTSYNDLADKPQLDGRPIVGNIPELDPTVPDWAKAATPPAYTAEDVGAIPDGAITVLDGGDFEEMWESL